MTFSCYKAASYNKAVSCNKTVSYYKADSWYKARQSPGTSSPLLQAVLCYKQSSATSSPLLQAVLCYKQSPATSRPLLQAVLCYKQSSATSSPLLQAVPCYKQSSATWHSPDTRQAPAKRQLYSKTVSCYKVLTERRSPAIRVSRQSPTTVQVQVQSPVQVSFLLQVSSLL